MLITFTLAIIFLLIGFNIRKFNTINIAVFNYFNTNKITSLTTISSLFSYLGLIQIIFIFAATISILMTVKKKVIYPWPAIGAIACYVMQYWLKELFHIGRPSSGGIKLVSYAYPSGHALQAAFLFGFIFYLRFRKKNIYLSLVSILIIIGVGWSRLYLGVHWLTDVIGGYLAGFSILILIVLLKEYLTEKYDFRIKRSD